MYFISGYHGSGKTTAATFLQNNYGFTHIERSSVLNAARAHDTEQSADMRSWRSRIQKKFGRFALEDIIIQHALQEIERGSADAYSLVITGNRSLDEIRYTSDFFKEHGVMSKTISIIVEPELLFSRFVERGRSNDDNGMSRADFEQLLKREDDAGILDILDNSDYLVENSGTNEDLFDKLRAIVSNDKQESHSMV